MCDKCVVSLRRVMTCVVDCPPDVQVPADVEADRQAAICKLQLSTNLLLVLLLLPLLPLVACIQSCTAADVV